MLWSSRICSVAAVLGAGGRHNHDCHSSPYTTASLISHRDTTAETPILPHPSLPTATAKTIGN